MLESISIRSDEHLNGVVHYRCVGVLRRDEALGMDWRINGTCGWCLMTLGWLKFFQFDLFHLFPRRYRTVV